MTHLRNRSANLDPLILKLSHYPILAKPPTAANEYTPAQRRTIDAQLAEAEEDVNAGRVHGPFTAKEASEFLERFGEQRSERKTTLTRR